MSSQIFAAATFQCHPRSVRSLPNILRQSLSERRHKPSSPNPILLFALAPSSTTPPEILSDITSTIIQLCPEHVGCISAPLPYQHSDPRMRSQLDSCSLAYAFVNAVSFCSTVSGRAETQVGRWHAARQRTENANGSIQINSEDSQIQVLAELSEFGGKVDWEDVWNRTVSSRADSLGSDSDSTLLPDALRNLDPLAIDNILYFSDKSPEWLGTVLEGAFPRANKLSLIASSTPFITGRPVTLFHNGSILSNGAVGIAFSSPPSSPQPAVGLSFPPLVTLSTDLTVTGSEGNLILSLDCGNPTNLLLSAIQKHALPSSYVACLDKKYELYVGVIDSSSQRVSQLHRVNAGDPSRGSIALDGASAPPEGSIVRLYRLPSEPVLDNLAYTPRTVPEISLFVAPEMTSVSFRAENVDDIATEDDRWVVSGAFLAASENGFTLSRGAQGPWKCVVPGARTGLSWSKVV